MTIGRTVGLGVTGVLLAPEIKRQTKGYIAQQRAGVRKISGPHAPGEVPPMKKISARRVLDHYLEKQAVKVGASFGGMASSLPAALLMGAGLAAGGLLASGGASGVANMFQRHKSERMFEELKRRYPEVRRHPKGREYFDMIVAYAPSLMRHPAAIGDFLKRQLEYPMTSVEFIKQLADLEGAVAKTHSYSTSKNFGQAVQTGASTALGPLSMGLGPGAGASRPGAGASRPRPQVVGASKSFMKGYPG
jgi:hypothetical protein